MSSYTVEQLRDLMVTPAVVWTPKPFEKDIKSISLTVTDKDIRSLPEFWEAKELLGIRLFARAFGHYACNEGISPRSVSWLRLKGASFGTPHAGQAAAFLGGNPNDFEDQKAMFRNRHHPTDYEPSKLRHRAYDLGLGTVVLSAMEMVGYDGRDESTSVYLSVTFDQPTAPGPGVEVYYAAAESEQEKRTTLL